MVHCLHWSKEVLTCTHVGKDSYMHCVIYTHKKWNIRETWEEESFWQEEKVISNKWWYIKQKAMVCVCVGVCLWTWKNKMLKGSQDYYNQTLTTYKIFWFFLFSSIFLSSFFFPSTILPSALPSFLSYSFLSCFLLCSSEISNIEICMLFLLNLLNGKFVNY